MYKDTKSKTIKTGGKYLVSFCKDCDSQNIEVTYTCKDCGSHNVETPTMNMLSKDERAFKQDTMETTVSIYECDLCKKEFEVDINKEKPTLYEKDGYVTLDSWSAKKIDMGVYNKRDICPECLSDIADMLNGQIDKVTLSNNVMNTIKELETYIEKPIKYVIKAYNFKEVTMAAPTQFSFTDENNTEWFFRYRHGKWQLYRRYDFESKSDIFMEGTLGDSSDGYITKESFIELMKDSGIRIEIESEDKS